MVVSRTAAALRRWILRRSTPTPHLVLSATITTSNDGGQPAVGPGPPPIRVALTESAGRGVFATRGIGAGDLIHTAKPLLAHPSPSLSKRVCTNCLMKLGNEEAFSNDTSYHFCSEKCRDHSKAFVGVERKADWSLFEDHCRIQGLKYPFMVKRLACMVIAGAESPEILDVLQPASLVPAMILEMEEEFELLKQAIMKAHIVGKMIEFLTKQWYINVLARIRINSFRIELIGGSYQDLFVSASATVAAEAAVGNALYMLPSFYNHDCDPNTHIVWIDSADARLKALRDIEKGEELRICYIDTSMDLEARQTLLAEGFGFRCRCLRCLSGD